MKTIVKIFSIVTTTYLLISCADNSITNNPLGGNNETNFTYPVKLNTFWYYVTRNFLTNLRGDSVYAYFSTDTIVGFGGAKFIKDTIINSDTLHELSNYHSDTASGHNHTTLEFYKQSDSGLIRIAYYSDGANFGPYRLADNSLLYSINGKHFRSLNDILSYYNHDYQSIDTLYFDDPPLRVLKYPLSQNNEWEFVSYSGNPRITKKYIDYETVNLTFGSFYCIKVKRNWYYNSTTPDPKFNSIDYFSKDGMVKRDFIIKDVLVQNQNLDTIGIFDVKDEAELLNLIQP